MRILFAIPHLPSSIRPRSFNLIKNLSRMHEVSLVALLADDYERAMVQDIAQYCTSIDLIPLPRWQAYANCLLALPTLTPLRIAYYRSPAFTQRIKEVIHRQKIDIVHGELIKVAPALNVVLAEEGIPVLFDSVDCISWFLQQQLHTTTSPLKKIFVYSELLKVRRYERLKLLGFDQVTSTSAADRERLARQIGQQENGHRQDIRVVSNCVATDYFIPWTAPRTSNSLVFCGKLDYFPNAQAIQHFCENILPLVWQQQPDARLTIVGNNPPQSVQALGNDKRITVTGYVPDVRPYLGSASVALAPLLVASGTQNKILEALAMCTPVVTTPQCSRALGTQDGVHLLTAEGPQAYADAIVQLLNDPLLGQRLGQAGRQFVVENYSWESAINTLNELYLSIMAKRKQKILAAVPVSR